MLFLQGYMFAALVFNALLSTQGQTAGNYATQTVYGFLDFTTTIGNTIMVFSPQSAPPPEPAKPSSSVVVNVIETKPTREAKTKDIQPSKTATKASSQKLSSVVHVIAGPAPIANSQKVQIVSSKVEVVTSVKNSAQPVFPDKKKVYSKVEVKEASPIVVNPVVNPLPTKVNEIAKPVYSSIVEVRSEEDPDPVIQIGNNLAEPEYDFLSRQPSEFAEETYRVINLKPTAKAHHKNNRATQHGKRAQTAAKDAHPTGLVTKLTGTVVKDGYAQVLQSSSQVYRNNKPRISPSSTLRILKTAAPTAPGNRHVIDPTPSNQGDIGPLPGDHNSGNGPNHIRASRRPATSSGSFKNRFRNKSNKDEGESEPSSTPSNTSSHGTTKKTRSRNKPKNRRNKSNRNSSFKTTTTTPVPPTESNFQRRGFKPKVQPSIVEPEQPTSLYKFKLNRTPGRWQYKTSPKPRVTIRKAAGEENAPPTPPTPSSEVLSNDIPSANARSDDTNDLESSGSISGAVLNEADTGNNGIEKRYPIETLNVEISTPADFKETYYEIATIKTPYTFQVGTVKNTRYITVTSTFEKSLEPEPTAFPSTLSGPLTENILASTTYPEKEQNLLDSSIATLPALYLSSEGETPPLETMTETFSTTQDILKTHILPIVREGENATSITLIQTYHITRMVTATKTLPPMEAYQFIPSKRLKEFNSKLDEAGSELHLELDFGDDNDDDEDVSIVKRLPPDLDLANVGSDLDLFNINRSKEDSEPRRPHRKYQKASNEQTQNSQNNISPEQLQQLALLRLLNPAAAAQLPQVITTSKPVLRLDTLYESHVIPVINGQLTSYSTISRPVGTVTKTEFEIGTSTLPGLPIPQVPVNPFQQQPQFQLTTAPVVTQTVITQTQSKILKLTFGAKTAYTTLFSTNVVPTLLTTYVTTSVAVQPTAAAFPGFFPAPYPPYPFVG